MGRKSVHRISEEKQEIMRKIIEGYNVQTTSDLQEALKDLLGGTIQTMLRLYVLSAITTSSLVNSPS